MKVCIYGAGAMGTILGAYITNAGYEIDLINRNKEHIAALKSNGATITGHVHFTKKVNALLVDEMDQEYDIILLMTKQKYNKQIVSFLQDFLSEDGVICTLQNGIPEPLISEIIDEDKIIGGTMSWGATLVEPGVCELTTVASRTTLTFSLGKYKDADEEKLLYIKELLETMGNVKIEKNLIGSRWAKLMTNAAFSGLSVISNATFGEIIDNKYSRKIALEIVQECIDVADAADIKIEKIQGKNIKKLIGYNSGFKKWISMMIIPYAMRKHRNIKSGMLRDLKKYGVTEIDAINGVVCTYARKHGVLTPLNDQIIETVQAIEDKLIHPKWSNINSLKK